MTLNAPVVDLICEKFNDEKVFIGPDIRRHTPKALIAKIEDELHSIDNEKEAFVLIENNVGDYCAPVVITDSNGCCAPSIYDQRSINKALHVSMFVKKDRHMYKNPYVEQNLYRLNYNADLYRLSIQRMAPKHPKPISTQYGQYKDHRLVIVGGGASWQDIEWKRKANDVMVMIVNYNFKLKANFLIYNDKKVGRDLQTVDFLDNRLIIGWKDHTNGIRDFVYTIPNDTVQVSHTGAMAIQIAEKMGFNKVYLAGFDYKKNKDGNDQVYKKDKNDYYKDSRIKRFLSDYDKFKTERTFNLNKESRLQKLPFANVEEIYAFNNL